MKKLKLTYLILLTGFLLSFSLNAIAQDKIDRAISSTKSGDYVTAIGLFQGSMSGNDDYEANYYYGKALLETGSLIDAEKY